MSEDVGYIDPSTVNPSTPLPFVTEEEWRDVGRKESLRSKLIVLLAFGGEFPDADQKSWIKYNTYRGGGIKMEAPKPKGNRSAWRGLTKNEDGEFDAEVLRKKWWELVEIAQKTKEAREQRDREREEAKKERERREQFVAEEFETLDETICDAKTKHLLPRGVDMGGKRAYIDVFGTGKFDLGIEDLTKEELRTLRDFMDSEFT